VRDYVTTRWGQVHLRRAGVHGPAVVLLHESPLSSVVYEPVLGPLGSAARAIAFDTPGYGGSDAPPGQAEIADYAATLLEAIDALAIDRFAVVGAHTGASIAVQLAVQAPDRVTHAVLSGVPVWSAEERARYLESWAPPVAVADDGGHLAWAWSRYERIWGGPPELLHVAVSTLLANLDRYHLGYEAAFRYDPMPDLAHVRCPVLLYTAEQDLLIASDEVAVELFPDARLEPVPGYRGQLPARMPEAFAARVLRFVTETV
jgi:pimeloyl-ACP methyl ester carboxylesterase